MEVLGFNKGFQSAVQGFAAGCSNGSVSIWEREADHRLFKRVWQASVEGLLPSILAIVLTPSEEALLLTTAGHQLLKRKLTGFHQVQSFYSIQHARIPTPTLNEVFSMGFAQSKHSR